MSKLGVWAVIAVGHVGLSAAGAEANKGRAGALDKPAFTASPAELLAVAKAAPAAGDAPIVMLREERERSLDDHGRLTERSRYVYVIRTQGGVDGFDGLYESWNPTFQDRPRIRARVVDPRGTATELDPAVLAEAAVVPHGVRRKLSGTLPQVRVGSVVEAELVTADLHEVVGGARTAFVPVGDASFPIRDLRITFSAPAGRKARVHAQLAAGIRAAHAIAAGRETWRFELGPLAPVPDREPHTPGDVRTGWLVALNSGSSWNAAARAYREVVERQLVAGAVPLPSTLPRTPSLEAAAAITAWVHAHVRSTEVSFAQTTRVPRPPAETLKQAVAAPLDRAVLVIALLRQAGLRADLALLDTGPGVHVYPELPDIGAFDHVLVRARAGARDVWIDPDEPLLPPGQLPARAQGRRVLVIADDTTRLTETPAAPATDNLVREVRTYHLAELDEARATEVSVEGGAYQPIQRAWIRDVDPARLREDLTRYAEAEYGAAYARFTHTPVTDLATPFATTLEMSRVKHAVTHRGHIEVVLYAGDTFAKVPPALTDEELPARRAAFAWFIPHVYEIENRLVVPPGYTIPAAAPERVRRLGTATLIERQRVDGRTLVVTYRFESGKPHLSAAEATAVARALREMKSSETRILFEHTAWALAEQGKPREALAEVHRLIQLHPREAIHHTQRAYILIQAGMGSAARRAARRAVELEPKNADAHTVLGWVLARDSLGREYGFDHDRAGALAALRTARRLHPTHAGAAVELAKLLQLDARGAPYDTGSDLAGAAEAWRKAYELDATAENGLALAKVLIWSGKYPEAEKVLAPLAASDDRDAWLVALAGASSGAAAATAAVAKLRTGAAKTQLADLAAKVLFTLRHYDVMRALSKGTGPADAVLVQKVARHDAVPAIGRDPRLATLSVLQLGFELDRLPFAFWDAPTEREQRAALELEGSASAQLGLLHRAVRQDLLFSLLETRIEGADPGPWRVETRALGHSGAQYVALDRGAAKVFGGVDTPAGVGRHVLRLVARKELAAATRVLDWAARDLGPQAGLDAVWGAGLPRDADAIAIAGAILAADSAPDQTIPLLSRCASSAPKARTACDRAQGGALWKLERWRELEAHATVWASRKVDVGAASMARVRALIGLGKLDDAERVLEDVRATAQSHPNWHRMAVEIAVTRGQLAEALERSAPLVTRQDPDAVDQNNTAWLHLVAETDLPAALALARTSHAARPHTTTRNTLAAIHAELGDVHAAKTEQWAALAHPRAAPEASAWYVVGRIAEQLGLRDDAIAAYRRVARERSSSALPSSYELAQRRLRKLGVKPR